jgi:hypothetical protein
MGEHAYVVEKVLDQWYDPDATYFKIQADDGNFYILRSEAATGEWNLVSFRKA